MRIDVSDPLLRVCHTCVQHRTLSVSNAQETEPANVIDPSATSVQPLGSTSDQSSSPISSGTEQHPLAPLPVTTTSVNPEPLALSGDAPADASATPTSPLQTTFSFPPAAFSSSTSSSRLANITNILDSGASAASVPSMFGPMQAPKFGSRPSSSTPSPFDAPSSNGPNTPFSFLPAAQDSRIPTPFGYPGYPPSPFGQTPQTITPVSGRSLFMDGVGTEQGSRYPRYAPTLDFDHSGGPGKLITSISASSSRGNKSHEELRWEDYKNGDKGGFGWFAPAHTVSPSLFASPSIIPDRPRMRTTTWQPQGNMNGLPMGFTNPAGLQRPHHEPVGVSPPASGCTACGATSSSSPSGHAGFTNPPSSAATTLPYGSMPLMFGAPNPAGQAYAVIFVPMTTITPAVQPYPMLFGTPNLVGQQGTTTTTPAVQPYTTMFGTPNLAAQGASPAPAFQPNMFGTPSFAGGQGTTTTAPAAQLYPMMFGTPNLAGQGTTTTPSAQPYAMMFGTPNLGAQGITPAAQAYPVNGLNLPFAAMNLQ